MKSSVYIFWVGPLKRNTQYIDCKVQGDLGGLHLSRSRRLLCFTAQWIRLRLQSSTSPPSPPSPPLNSATSSHSAFSTMTLMPESGVVADSLRHLWVYLQLRLKLTLQKIFSWDSSWLCKRFSWVDSSSLSSQSFPWAPKIFGIGIFFRHFLNLASG